MSIVVYGLPTCKNCDEVKKYLEDNKVPYVYQEVGKDIVKEQLELVVSRVVRAVPVITFYDGEISFAELKAKVEAARTS